MKKYCLHGLLGIALGALLGGGVTGGCGSSGPKMVHVAGQVKVNGQSLAEGIIDFRDPQGNTPSAQAPIHEGAYSCQMLPGHKKVIIQGFKVVGQERASRVDPESPLVDRKQQFLPAKYSSETTTELSVEIGPGGNRSLNFDLKIP